MSDCSMGGRRFYNVPTHTPAEDRLEITVHFEGEFNPHPIVLNRLDREVDYVEVDGERFERVSEREIANDGEYVYKRECIANGVYTAESTGEEIVRCRDCAFFVADVSTVDESGSVIATDNLCEWTELWVEPNDFCAWAERKECGE